jgi:hypothetical protein
VGDALICPAIIGPPYQQYKPDAPRGVKDFAGAEFAVKGSLRRESGRGIIGRVAHF